MLDLLHRAVDLLERIAVGVEQIAAHHQAGPELVELERQSLQELRRQTTMLQRLAAADGTDAFDELRCAIADYFGVDAVFTAGGVIAAAPESPRLAAAVAAVVDTSQGPAEAAISLAAVLRRMPGIERLGLRRGVWTYCVRDFP
jgi:hypothetical protein